jgi:hypothetical protein
MNDLKTRTPQKKKKNILKNRISNTPADIL